MNIIQKNKMTGWDRETKRDEILTHADICLMAGKWLKSHYKNTIIPNCPTIAIDMRTIEAEIPDVIGWSSGSSVLIEVKVSRSDFLKDKKKRFRKYPELGVGELRYFCCPTGLIKKDEIPKDWGLLYIDVNNIRIIERAKFQETNIRAERNMLISINRRSKQKEYIKKIMKADEETGIYNDKK